MLCGFVIASRIYWISVVIFLFAASLAKLLSSFLDLPIQAKDDPLFGLSQRSMWRIGFVLDLVFVGMLCAAENLRNQIIAWIGALFLSYHAMIWLMQLPTVCPCLGNAAAWLGLTESAVGKLSRGFSVYMLLGGVWLWKEGRKRARTALRQAATDAKES
ncbi:MAG: hypothetical protein HW389_2702 [Bacteroidetes bacterium]|nr:hypothetical protein [Bacteroidota bacterium]